MKIIPVSRVGQGIGLSGPPTMLSRSAGMPEKSKPMAAIARIVTAAAMPSTPTPDSVS